MPEPLIEFLQFVDALPRSLQLFFIFFGSFIEYVFPIFPGDTVVLFAAFSSSFGEKNLTLPYVAATLGSVIGSMTIYLFGYLLTTTKNPSRFLRQFLHSPRLQSFKYWFEKWGYPLIAFNRFFPSIRSFFFLGAGITRLKFLWVITLGGVSASIFNLLIFSLGVSLENNFSQLLEIFNRYTQAIYFLFLIIFLIWALKYFLSLKKK